MERRRRQLLAALAGTGVATLAGCSDVDFLSTETATPTETSTDARTDDTATAATDTPAATATPTATLTPTATAVSSPTDTPEPTDTPSPTPTPSPTATPVDDSPPSEQTTPIPPVDGDEGDWFGKEVAMSSDGTTAVVSAERDEDPNGRLAGSAYVFARTDGTWRQQAKLAADDGSDEDRFGSDVDIAADGDAVVVGARNVQDPNGDESGAAYVFERSGGGWTQTAKIVPDDGDTGDHFGASVAIGGDATTVAVGAVSEEDPYGPNAGSVYVFERSGDAWKQTAEVVSDQIDSDDRFGSRTAISDDGSTLLVGVPRDNDPYGELAGAVYVFEPSSGSWRQRDHLIADDGDQEDRFGESLALSADGSTVLVGARTDEEANGPAAGSAYLFERSGGSWRQQHKLAPTDGDEGDQFGSAVALSNDATTAVVGAWHEDDPYGAKAGTAYTFTRSNGGWEQQAKLLVTDGDEGDEFGSAAALSADGTTAIIGAWQDNDPNGEQAGSAYVFE